jgi:glutaconate CoA-transferase subunit A
MTAPASDKRMSMREAIARFVADGDCVVIEGFTHLIDFAAGHEIIRQRRRDLVLARLTPDLVYDQLIAAGCARKLVFSWAGNPGAGSLYAVRRAVEEGIPAPLELEEYSHFGMVARFTAGAAKLPFAALRTFSGSDLPAVNPAIREVVCPYTGERIPTVPALRPDVAIVHVQRASADGSAQVWGLLGVQKEVAFAARRVIVAAEEIVDESVVRADPNRTLLPGFVVDAVVCEPWGCHPSYAQGYYDRDNEYYVGWGEIARERATLERWLDEWVHGVSGRAEYVEKMGGRLERLRARPRPSGSVDYGY